MSRSKRLSDKEAADALIRSQPQSDAHLIAAREWLKSWTPNDARGSACNSLAALLAEWERNGLERAELECLRLRDAARKRNLMVYSDTWNEAATSIRYLAQPPSTDKP